MQTRSLLILLVLSAAVSVSSPASAQLFGDRKVGPQPRTGTPLQGGFLQGVERFLRGSRSPDSFVGAGSAATSAFAGGSTANAAATTTSSSVTGLTEEAVPPVNRPKQRKTGGIYAERLNIAFEAHSPNSQAPTERPVISQRLADIAATRDLSVTVSATRAATVRGTVRSQHEKRLAELLVLFEPGIETVTNELHVEPTAPPSR